MLRNYFKIACRNLLKNKLDSFISIGGLALGIACCILLILFVHFEWSFDDFHSKTDRIYRVVLENRSSEGNSSLNASVPYQLGPELKANYPEVQEVVRLMKSEVELQRDQDFLSQQVLFADSTFFKVFDFDLLRGNPESVLDNLNNILLTESKARQLFGNSSNAIGKEVAFRLYEELRYYQVAGIVAAPPANSSISFEVILPKDNFLLSKSELFRKIIPQRWDIGVGEVYLFLNPQPNSVQLESKLPDFVEEHFGSNAENTKLSLQPMTKIYLNPDVSSPIAKATSPVYSWVLAGIAVIVLIIACINFMSLTLSRSTARIKEIGIRKASGAGRRELRLQFLGEALLTCLLAFILGIFLAELALPYFRSLVDKPVSFVRFASFDLWLLLSMLVFISALITGLYPAMVMSRKSTSDFLVSNRSVEQIPSFVRGLIVAQFGLSLVFVSSAFIMHKQMDFILERDLGFEEENVIVVNPNTDSQQLGEIYQVFEQEARRLAAVQNITATFSSYTGALLYPKLQSEEDHSVEVGLDLVGSHFLETLQIELIEGRGFNADRPADLKWGALVNRAFVDHIGWENAIGREIPSVVVPESQEGSSYMPAMLLENKQIIGVVENFHYQSLYNELKPLVLVGRQAMGKGVGTIWIKTGERSGSELSSSLESIWQEIAPAEPFVYSFLDDALQQQYTEDQRWKRIIDIASLFAIVLAYFGLFGLAMLSAQRRTKEIGIRKVLGATISSIVGLLTKDFLKLVLLGFVIAVPVAWYAMNRWLADFAYRIEIGAGVFLLAGGAALLIALATVSLQSVRAALANPVDSLRAE